MSGRRAETPMRATRSQRGTTPLPALQTKQSHAYGAAGKASLQQQMTTSASEIDEAFASTARQQVREPAPAPRRNRRTKSVLATSEEEEQRQQQQQQAAETTADEAVGTEAAESTEESRPGTAIDSSAAYDHLMPPPPRPAPRPAPIARPPVRLTSPRSAPHAIAPQVPPPAPPPQQPATEPLEDHSLWLYYGTSWRLFKEAFVIFLCFLFWFSLSMSVLSSLVTIYVWMPLPASMEPGRDRFCRHLKGMAGLPEYDQPPNRVEAAWIYFKHARLWEDVIPETTNITQGTQFFINMHLNHRINETENALREHSQVLSELMELVPDRLALTKRNGEWEIPTLFWEALLDKLGSGDASPLWDRFLDANKQNIVTLQDASFEERFDQRLSSLDFISKQEFQETLAQNQQFFEENQMEMLNKFSKAVIEEAREAARSTAEEAVSKSLNKTTIGQMFKMQAQTLAYANLAYNTDELLRNVNYFSPGQGALVDPHYTSPTYNAPTNYEYFRLWFWWMTGFGNVHKVNLPQNPPIVALSAWQEATQCWCPEAMEFGPKGQIGVLLRHRIIPSTLLIEHIYSRGTRNIAAAPRHFDVWGQVESEEEAIKLDKGIRQHQRIMHLCGNPPNDGQKNWVCMGGGEYDIHGHNHIQTFELMRDSSVDVVTKRVVIKFVTNWGMKDHTCLYRLRLHAAEVGEPEETQPDWVNRPTTVQSATAAYAEGTAVRYYP